MISSPIEYCRETSEACGAAWNEFWFTPRDPQPLAILRIAVGLIGLYFLGSYGPDLIEYFGPAGLLPAESVKRYLGGASWRPSPLYGLTSAGELWAFLLASLVVVLLLIIGLWTRIAAILSLAAVLSFIHRGPMLTSQLEPVLAFTLLYLVIAPSGARYSVDAWRRRDHDLPSRYVSATLAARLLQVHTCIVYAMMGVTMLSAPSLCWWDGEAVWYLIAQPDSRLVDLSGLHDWPRLLSSWSHAIVLFLLAFPIFVWNSRLRPLMLALSIPHWLLLGLVTGLMPFCLLMSSLGLAFIEPPAEDLQPAA